MFVVYVNEVDNSHIMVTTLKKERKFSKRVSKNGIDLTDYHRFLVDGSYVNIVADEDGLFERAVIE